MNEETTSGGRFDDVNRKRGGLPPDEWFRHPTKEHMTPAAALIDHLKINAKASNQNGRSYFLLVTKVTIVVF